MTITTLVDSALSFDLEFSSPVEAGALYGRLLELDQKSEVYYAIHSPTFDVIIDEDDEEIAMSYVLNMKICYIPEDKIQRILDVLLEK
jgi:hypothetical protein